MFFFYFRCIFYWFFSMENLFYLLFLLLLLCRRGNDHFDVSFWWIKLVPFPSKDGKDAVYEGRNGGRGVYFLPESAVFLYLIFGLFFPICTLNCCVNKSISLQRKGINRKNESNIFILYFCNLWYCIEFPEYVNCLLWLKFSPHNKSRFSPLLSN